MSSTTEQEEHVELLKREFDDCIPPSSLLHPNLITNFGSCSLEDHGKASFLDCTCQLHIALNKISGL
jgi:hypothetical protein